MVRTAPTAISATVGRPIQAGTDPWRPIALGAPLEAEPDHRGMGEERDGDDECGGDRGDRNEHECNGDEAGREARWESPVGRGGTGDDDEGDDQRHRRRRSHYRSPASEVVASRIAWMALVSCGESWSMNRLNTFDRSDDESNSSLIRRTARPASSTAAS